ncbi:phospholipase D-like domain-containing protein [Marinimicrobium locisalis]|uniref:phospholipase D-like domain-containing protein n=1 Tax=Marinimicrobium locisalis TaxID=546022 RepID=UPI003221B884
MATKKSSVRRYGLGLLGVLAIVLLATGLYGVYKPLPEGVGMEAPPRPATGVRFLADRTYVDEQGTRHTEQSIFDEIFRLIEQAERFVLVDMFLFNAYQGQLTDTHRALSSELTDRLIAQKKRHPDMQILVISDPLNTLYGGLPSPHFQRLEAAGISVTLTDLPRLRDSNPLYSSIWRPFIQPWGNSPGDTLPNPFGEGEVSLRSYLALINFKANHRKLLIADEGEALAALVTSANPHDGSSAHGNVALRFSGPATGDLLQSEAAVLEFSGGPAPSQAPEPGDVPSSSELTVQVVTERAVERAALALIDGANTNEHLDMAMFYLSDRHLVRALQEAAERGVKVRVLLDPNKDAFGREKNGVPNRPVAHELVSAGVALRWCDTHGEQCHAKWLMHRDANGAARMLLGSTNFTRRNLHNLNLETSVVLRGPLAAEPLTSGAQWFDERWHNRRGRHYSVDYEVYADESLWPRLQYRLMEATGLSTF